MRKGVNKWWELTRPRVEVFGNTDEAIFCSKRFGGIHSFAIIPQNYVVEEGNVFLFKKRKKYCEDDKFFYLALFSSIMFQRMLSIYGRPLMSGYDLGKVQIKDIPIVDVAQHEIRGSEEYRHLVEYGRSYSEGLKYERDNFDKFVLAFYW